MPVLLRRNAPTSTVQELADGYPCRRRELSRKGSRRVSAPEEPLRLAAEAPTVDNRPPSRSEPSEFIQKVKTVDDGDDKTDALDVKPRLTLVQLMNHPRLAFELNRLPKTYVRLCWDRVVTSVRRTSIFSSKKKEEAERASEDTTIPPTSPSSNERPSSSASDASSDETPKSKVSPGT
ncbi:Aste57867_17757 [Aphanomyces stellatus]|uniref:Aste57867_17757 protein n=1 Tax=Aphanomyces stellatus TaxID=120398 RepID=A0A485L8K5_9STRA|nr:hypothetical protein As57867_017696 [Aphanomyces stellatus]VFT94503.1 Aste57867_17757 [Aphanomyces stellatus]